MIGQPDDTGREQTGGVARIWQRYADEIGLPDASAVTQTVPALQSAKVPPSTPQRRARRMRVRLGVATAAVALKPVTSTAATEAPDEGKSKGYRETTHVRDYYRTAKI